MPKWEKALLKQYTAMAPSPPASNTPRQLRFLHDYEHKYPQLHGLPPDTDGQSAKAHGVIKEGQGEPEAIDYAKYICDRKVCALQMRKKSIEVENDERELAALEALVKLREAERIVSAASGAEQAADSPGDGVNPAPDANNDKPGKAADTSADYEREISELYKRIQAKRAIVNASRCAALDFDINRLWALKTKTDLDTELGALTIFELAKQDRNRIIGDLMVLARRVHDMKDRTLYYSRATINSLFDFSQIIATSVAGVAGSENTARALAVAATGSAAAQESFDTRFFYQHATAAVIAIMNKQRHEAEEVLVANMRKDVLDYPLRVALADYARFLLAGGLPEALSELGTDAKVKELQELRKLNELKKMSEAHLEELQKQEAERATAEAAKKAKQDEYLALVEQALAAVPGMVPVLPVP